MEDFDMLNAPTAGNGVGSEEDPAAAFLAQQESEIAGIENDEGFSILDSGDVPSSLVDSNGGWPPGSSWDSLTIFSANTACLVDLASIVCFTTIVWL